MDDEGVVEGLRRGDEAAHRVTGRRPGPARPGAGWPGDRATAGTAVAADPDDVARLAATAADLEELDAHVSVCRACPRLVGWREEVARVRRAAYAEQPYWGRPVTGLGPEQAGVVVVGLAPAAHGGNRTGRVFTGDRSGDWLFAGLHRAGLANQASSSAADDGLVLLGTRVLAAVRCAPPVNKPTAQETARCRPWLVRELALTAGTARAYVALGGFAWSALLSALPAAGVAVPTPRPPFRHGGEVALDGGDGPATLLGCYHPSQQNTFTGRLTGPMLDAVLGRAADLAGERARR